MAQITLRAKPINTDGALPPSVQPRPIHRPALISVRVTANQAAVSPLINIFRPWIRRWRGPAYAHS